MQTFETTYDCNGQQKTYLTQRNSGESVEDFVDRHSTGLEAAKAAC